MGFEKHIDKRILKIAKDIVEKWNVCDNCLGRQFAQIGRGFTNQERGRVIRKVLLSKKQAKPFDPKKGCEVCLGFFQNIDKWVEKALKALRGLEFQSFLVGTLMSDEFAKREESLWEDVGIEYCESIKAEINREVGKLIEKKTGKKVDKENPDVVITLDLQNQKIDIRITSVYFYGEYKKLIRGIPQTKWDKYPLTIEDIIAKPFMEALKGKAHAMHAAGREDIDARCLDWRPFVLEIIEPKKRDTDLSKIQKIINETGMIEVRNLRKTDRHDVVRVKSMSPDKTYRILVEFEKPLKDLERLKSLIGPIKQKTPTRVLHRRADRLRIKRVKDIKWKVINNKNLELIIKGQSGLYIKELVTGDDGRTRPSVSEILDNPGKVIELDVIKIHLEEA